MSVEQELIDAENARRAAITRGDCDAVEAMIADTFHYAHISGFVETREQYLERERNKRVIRATSSRDLKVRLRPGYALLSGISRIETAAATIETLFLSVWERGAGGWKISGYASTPKPGEKYPF